MTTELRKKRNQVKHPKLRDVVENFEKQYPGFTIGKIEVWDANGTATWKRIESRRNWQARMREKIL